jgi:hypothetical protein
MTYVQAHLRVVQMQRGKGLIYAYHYLKQKGFSPLMAVAMIIRAL